MPELTLELIVDQTRAEDLDLSPDGRFVVYALVPVGNREEHPLAALWVAPTDAAQAPRQFTAGLANDRAPRWSPDGEHIAFLSDRARRGSAALYRIAADGGEARPLTPTTNKKPILSFAWSPGGGHLAFTSADEPDDADERREKERDDADVYGERMPFARLRLIARAGGDVALLAGGERHVDSFAWSPSGAEIAFSTKQSPDLESRDWEGTIERVAVGGGAPHPVCRFPCAIASLCWTADGRTLLFEAPVARRSQSSTAIYAVDATGGEPRLLALGDDACSDGLLQPAWSPAADAQPLCAVASGLATRLCRLDPSTGALAPLLTGAAEQMGLEAWTARARANGDVVLAAVRSAGEQPPELWAGSAALGGAWRRLSAHATALAGIRFGPQEPFHYQAPDGWEMDGLLVRPPDARPDRPLPMVTLVHGGPYARYRERFYLGWAEWAQWLALAGYAVLLPNPRGGKGHGEQFAAAARGDVGGADYLDVMAAVDAAVSRGIADPDRLAIGGWSQGGFMSAWAVTQTRRFKAAIMGAGVSEWGMMTLTSDVPDFELSLGGSAPWDGAGPHRHAALSPISFAGAVRTPVLILHGQNDARVPLGQAIGFHRALRRHGVPTELVVYPREPHGIREHAHQIDVLRRVRSWCDRWLGT
jgi:dipeptidyl aminopeptidase/acylaminoacyl peptidase